MKTRLMLITALALAFAAAQPATADRVRMRSGKEIEGLLGESSGDKLRVWMGPAQLTLPRAQVASVTTDTMAVNMLIDARYHLEGRRYEEGVEKLGLAAQQDAPADRIAALLTEHGDALADAIPHLTQSSRDGLSLALATLDTLPGAQSRALASRRLFLHVALGEGEKGEAILNALGVNYFSQHPVDGARLTGMLEKALEGWSQAEDFPRGQTIMQMLEKIAPRRAEGAAIQFYLQWASVERRDGRYESALRIYTRYLMRLAPQIGRDRILTALKEAELSAREHKRLMEAAQLYVSYGIPHAPEAARERLAQIWIDEGRVRLWGSDFPGARLAFETAEQYKKGAAALELLRCEWRERRARLAPEDFKGHYDLGVWCEDKDLLNEALTEYRAAFRAPELMADADAKIQTIESKQAEAELQRIMALYEAGDYGKVMMQIEQYMHQDRPAGFLAQAKQIQDMTREALNLRTAQRPQQAESLYNQAEQAFYEEDYARAQGMLDTLAKHYSDTPSFTRASVLSALVSQKLDVAALESGRKPRRAAASTSATLAGIHITTGTRSTVRNAIDDRATSAGMNAPVKILWPGLGGHPAPAKQPVTAPQPATPRQPAPAAQPTPKAPSPAGKSGAENDAINDAFRRMMQQEGVTNGRQ